MPFKREYTKLKPSKEITQRLVAGLAHGVKALHNANQPSVSSADLLAKIASGLAATGEVDTMVALGVEVNIAAGVYLATDWYKSNDGIFVGRDENNRIVFVIAEIRSSHLLSKGSDGTVISRSVAEGLARNGGIAPGDHVVHIIAKRLSGLGNDEHNLIGQNVESTRGVWSGLEQAIVSHIDVHAENFARLHFSFEYADNRFPNRSSRFHYHLKVISHDGKSRISSKTIRNPLSEEAIEAFEKINETVGIGALRWPAIEWRHVGTAVIATTAAVAGAVAVGAVVAGPSAVAISPSEAVGFGFRTIFTESLAAVPFLAQIGDGLTNPL
uniref:Uncharacterized protein n=1 Tax=Plectus sambesii TaxID=2011161 RepID=A0A914WKS3_9BILA